MTIVILLIWQLLNFSASKIKNIPADQKTLAV